MCRFVCAHTANTTTRSFRTWSDQYDTIWMLLNSSSVKLNSITASVNTSLCNALARAERVEAEIVGWAWSCSSKTLLCTRRCQAAPSERQPAACCFMYLPNCPKQCSTGTDPFHERPRAKTSCEMSGGRLMNPVYNNAVKTSLIQWFNGQYMSAK